MCEVRSDNPAAYRIVHRQNAGDYALAAASSLAGLVGAEFATVYCLSANKGHTCPGQNLLDVMAPRWFVSHNVGAPFTVEAVKVQNYGKILSGQQLLPMPKTP